ncbi:(Fe-S)-binding protein [Desulfurispora thermophila]|uniref:(Fe-S)-binding protein n=1 Tax=Desulfurispora thermophila TaxID=265470 RepID=UPI00038221E3|nr:(Fe-S)-binding protein [Desulfurispora thermophila]
MLHRDEEARYHINRCSKCGSCREVCPVFLQTGSEPWVARARVQLAGAALAGQLNFSRRFNQIMDACLLCRACVAHCPNGVRVDELVLWARAKALGEKKPTPAKIILLRGALASPRRLKLLGRAAAPCQKAGLGKKLRGQILPALRFPPFTSLFHPQEIKKPSYTAAYFVGCLTQYVNHQTGQAVLKVLAQNNVQVLPADPGCCGMPALAAGDLKTARELARRNVASWQRLKADFIVTDCASCGEMLKMYGRLLAEDAMRKAAGEMASRVMDITAFLVHKTAFQTGRRKIPLTVTYHDPCHLKRGQGVFREPRQVLAGIPGLTLIEMTRSDTCCGLAGAFGITHPEISTRILAQKLENIKATGAQAVATGCPSCRQQLASGLARAGLALPVFHPVELLAMTYDEE